jgi:eukaryotic translation initiation factor 2C
MLQVKARVLDPANVYYNDMKPLQARNGQWRMMNKKFINTVRLEKWIIVWRMQVNDETRKLFLDSAKNSFTKNGLEFAKPPIVQTLVSKDMNIEKVFELINKNCQNPQLVLFILSDRDDEYAELKSAADQTYGISTQCLKYDKLMSQMRDERKLDMYLSNVALKINSKIGGTNNLVDFSNLQK